jgi:hypothetical protein
VGIGEAAVGLLGVPDHVLFGVIAVVPAAVQNAIEHPPRANPDVDDGVGLRAAALVLSASSVGSIGLVFGIARRAGLDSETALVGSTLLALSSSMLYYARHLLPYDMALCLVLAAMWAGAAPGRHWRASLGCGVLGGLAFLTYNGSWAGALASLGVHVCLGRCGIGSLARRLGVSGAGLLGVVGLAYGIGAALKGPVYLETVRSFAASVTTGDFDEGWSLPWEYLWQSEHGLVLVWAFGAALATWQAMRGAPAGRLAAIWLVAGLGIYVLLALTSTTLHVFVVYGRLARQLVPFLCLGASVGLVPLVRKPMVVALGALALVVQTTANVAPLVGMVFPRGFVADNGALDAGRTWTVVGPEDSGTPTRYVLVNAGVPWPILGERSLPAGRTVAWAPHPLRFLPYQYEGYAPRERAVLRSAELAMRLVDTSAVATGACSARRQGLGAGEATGRAGGRRRR